MIGEPAWPTLTAAGSCTLTVDQPGNANYSAAPTLDHSFSIARQTPTLTLSPSDTAYGTPLDGNQLTTVAVPFQVYANSIFSDTVGQQYASKGDLNEGLSTWQDQLVEYGNSQGFTVNK